jgi:dual specificity phosphatase 12
MGWVDQIPRCGKLYIGGLHALYQKPDLFAK